MRRSIAYGKHLPGRLAPDALVGMLVVRLDARPGGIFHYSMRAPDGREMWGKFVYREVAAPEKIVFVNSFSDEQGNLGATPVQPRRGRWKYSTH